MALASDTKVLYGILTCLWLEFLWELYLDIRQFLICKKTVEVPSKLENVMSNETYNKARLYSLDKARFGFIKSIFSILVATITLYSGVLATFWVYAESVSPVEGEVATSCIWLLILMTVSTFIDLPFTIYHTFVLEEKYGFNKQTAVFFVLDKVKAFVVGQAITMPIASLVIVIVKYGGDWFFVWLWMAVGIVVLILLTVYPSYIAPLFDKYTPLPEGELRTEIEKLASQLDFPLGQLYVVEGSKRSAHSNAYFYGLFGAKRIVLFDTLLANPDSGGCQNDEVLAVLSHELGHWSHGHIIKNIVIMQANLLFMFVVFAFTFHYPPIYRAVGFAVKMQPVLVGLFVVMQYVMMPYNTLLSFLLTCLSRQFEFQADTFAAKLGKSKPLQRALVQLNKDNLGFPVYDSLFSAWHHSHPPLLERLAALEESGTKTD